MTMHLALSLADPTMLVCVHSAGALRCATTAASLCMYVHSERHTRTPIQEGLPSSLCIRLAPPGTCLHACNPAPLLRCTCRPLRSLWHRERFGWDERKVEDLLGPVLTSYSQRGSQTRIEQFLSFRQRFAKIRSRRLQRAVAAITGGAADPELFYAPLDEECQPPPLRAAAAASKSPGDGKSRGRAAARGRARARGGGRGRGRSAVDGAPASSTTPQTVVSGRVGDDEDADMDGLDAALEDMAFLQALLDDEPGDAA